MSSECKVQEEGHGHLRVCHLTCRCLEACDCGNLHYRIQFASRVTTTLALCHFELMTSYPGFVDPELITFWYQSLLYVFGYRLLSWLSYWFVVNSDRIHKFDMQLQTVIYALVAQDNRNNKGCPPLTASRTSADCVKIHLDLQYNRSHWGLPYWKFQCYGRMICNVMLIKLGISLIWWFFSCPFDVL